jgi:hypothetical protein
MLATRAINARQRKFKRRATSTLRMLTHSYGCNPIVGWLVFDRIMLQIPAILKVTGTFSKVP